MDPESPLPCSQEPSTGPYPEPDQSCPQHPILSNIHFNIIHLPTRLPRGLFPSGFPRNILYAFNSPHSCYMPCPSHPPWLDHSNYNVCANSGPGRIHHRELSVWQYSNCETQVHSCNVEDWKSHPKTTLEYLHLALSAVATMCNSTIKFHNAVGYFLSVPRQRWKTGKLHFYMYSTHATQRNYTWLCPC
jgi:hypothetical protein